MNAASTALVASVEAAVQRCLDAGAGGTSACAGLRALCRQIGGCNNRPVSQFANLEQTTPFR